MADPHEIVIRLGRRFDIRTSAGAYLAGISEVTVPFGDRESAEAAQREITVHVRQVHDAGGEDYRPVVEGEVLPAGVDEVIRDQTARMRAAILAPKPDLGDGGRADLIRDMRDLRDLEGH